MQIEITIEERAAVERLRNHVDAFLRNYAQLLDIHRLMGDVQITTALLDRIKRQEAKVLDA